MNIFIAAIPLLPTPCLPYNMDATAQVYSVYMLLLHLNAVLLPLFLSTIFLQHITQLIELSNDMCLFASCDIYWFAKTISEDHSQVSAHLYQHC